MIGQDGCMDVASSLGLQGIDPSMTDISIPIYGPFYLQILIGQECGDLCNSLPEFTAVNQLNRNCGTVTIKINLLEMDIFTLVGGLLAFTPNTGMNCFLKLAAVDLINITADMLTAIVNVTGIPIPDAVTQGLSDITAFAGDILQAVFDMLIDIMDNDLTTNGINLREWTELPNFYNTVRASGEMQEMLAYRQQIGAFLF
jgi:hypothetical protein